MSTKLASGDNKSFTLRCSCLSKSAVPRPIAPVASTSLPQPPSSQIPTLFHQHPVHLPQSQQSIGSAKPQQHPPPSSLSGSAQTAMIFNQATSFMMSSRSCLPAFQPNMPPPALAGAPSSQAPQRSLLPGGTQPSSTATIVALAAAIQANSGGMGGLSVSHYK